ncbi:hypothetical protein [Mycobacteroides abscessus]|uniref:hypothetical protein n=1 Tax=Mycobacteroides abscessus TaxID=36809 RepID=UPI0018969AAA
MHFNYYNELRETVRQAAADGRATYLPAGARDNATARVLIDGEEVGQASTCMHLVRLDPADPNYGRHFGEQRLIPDNREGIGR